MSDRLAFIEQPKPFALTSDTFKISSKSNELLRKP